MPTHVLRPDSDPDRRPTDVFLAAELARLEVRERIVNIFPAGEGWVVVTEKKQGRPAAEKRVTSPKEAR